MRSSDIAFFLSICTSAATAATATAVPAPMATAATKTAPPTQVKMSAAGPKPVGAARPAAPARPAPARPAPELITAAAAVMHDGPPAAQPSPARSKADTGEQPRRTDSAMLLAALALMCGIALRRYSARDR